MELAEKTKQELIKIINDLNIEDNKPRNINFLAERQSSPCDGCPNQGKVCHCTMGSQVFY